MTDLSITAGNVVAGTGAVKETGVAASTITAGQAVYRDPTTLKFAPADADSATAAIRAVYGVALNGASANQAVVVQTAGEITIGATLTVGLVYVLSGAAGAIAPSADLSTGEYTTVIGIAKTTAILKLTLATALVAV